MSAEVDGHSLSEVHREWSTKTLMKKRLAPPPHLPTSQDPVAEQNGVNVQNANFKCKKKKKWFWDQAHLVGWQALAVESRAEDTETVRTHTGVFFLMDCK